MDLKKFEESIIKLFKKEFLDAFEDEHGFTNKTNNSISRVGYSTNLSLETIDIAIKNKIDLMITHHDAWDFIYGLRDDCIKKLKEHSISHFWIHSPLDFIEFGTCTSLMKVLEIDTIKQYSRFTNGETPGIGEFNETVDFPILVDRMRTKLNEPVRAWKNNNKGVKKVGVLTGAGHSTNHIKFALEAGCDTYITGEATLYTIQYAQFVGINLLVGSHTFTEIYGVESLAKRIQEFNNDIEIMELREEHVEIKSLSFKCKGNYT
ncbi:Nif3-like dinuclear metal center hexameric protein [Sutcliffiella halmapala]|uniref:Nif3-like dinuclear metal center hexameric protein n=1 Tax=Sutcliffiella halmapala TaxID=79882 RepID=UPI000995138D|nr:Nif3-like dinuclear metal center hexameric protein [Sutcliffiella halmapala]